MTPVVSVVIPAFEAAATVEKAIASALDGQGVAVEVLVVDDASTDDTGDRVAALAGRTGRVRLLRQAANGGAGAARNRGFAEAQGAWIALLDADDLFRPGRLPALLELADRSGADLVADDLLQLDPAGRPLRPAFGFGEETALDAAGFIQGNHLLRGGYTMGYLKPLIRTAFLRHHNLACRTDLPVAEDFHLVLDALLRGARYCLLPRALYGYRLRPGSLSRSLGLSDLQAMVRAGAETLDGVADPGLRHALATRQATLHMAIAHLELVETLKRRRPLSALRQIRAHPGVLPHLLHSAREGLGKRLRRSLAG